MNCPKCDFKNSVKSSFCSKCGTQLSLKKTPKKTPKKVSKKKPYVSHTKTIKATQRRKKELTTGSTFAGRYQVIEELGKAEGYSLVFNKVQPGVLLYWDASADITQEVIKKFNASSPAKGK